MSIPLRYQVKLVSIMISPLELPLFLPCFFLGFLYYITSDKVLPVPSVLVFTNVVKY